MEENEIKIGDQTWTSKNLDLETYRNGEVIPQVQDQEEWANLTTGAWCYYENESDNGTTYGKLYNWYAVNDERGLAPKGYHIPTDTEWTILTDYLGGESVAGTKMKSTKGWDKNGNGNNSIGFSGLPAGNINDGRFTSIGDYFGCWSSSEDDKNDAWARNLYCLDGTVVRFYFNKKNGLSVRCLKD